MLIRPGQRVLTLDPSMMVSRRAVAAPAGGNWWDGLTVAYQAKGAASYAASKVNLANPGTYDAGDGTAYPTWSAAGWALNGTDQYLTTGVTPDGNQTWSMLVAVSSGHVAIGLYDSYKKFGLWTRSDYGGQRIASSGDGSYGWVGVAPSTPFVFGFASTDAYYNGADEGDIPDEADTTYSIPITIGKLNGSSYWAAGTITAVAIKNGTLTAGEMAILMAAMAAL